MFLSYVKEFMAEDLLSFAAFEFNLVVPEYISEKEKGVARLCRVIGISGLQFFNRIITFYFPDV